MPVNQKSQGSAGIVRIGTRSISRNALIIGSLGLLNVILFFIAVVIGIYCGSVSEMSATQIEASRALILDVNHVQIMLSKTLEEQREAEQLLWEARRFHKQQTASYKQNVTLTDVLQIQLERLREEKASLASNSSQLQASCRRCLPGWYLYNTSCYFFSKSESMAKKTWQGSREHCNQQGATLVVINDVSEQVTVHENLPAGSGPNIRTWLGLSKFKDQWRWENNVTQQTEGYWMRGQPSDLVGLEQCAAILSTRDPVRAWIGTPCNWVSDWICEMEPVSG